METQLLDLTPYENFLFGMKAKETKRQYPHRLDKFLTFMSLKKNAQNYAKSLTKMFPSFKQKLFVLLIPK